MNLFHDTRRPLACIVPPHVLDAIAENGSEHQRQAALATLVLDAALRDDRIAMAAARATDGVPSAAEAPVKHRSIYDGMSLRALPGKLARDEGAPPTGDVSVDEAYDGLGATWDLYSEVFGRNSYDDAGAALVGTVHHQRNYNNAFWDGTQMAFGDGDGELFNRFTIAIDVTAHELTHAVTEHESNLVYRSQSGALNESLSDVFGSLVKQYVAAPQQTAEEADWLIGEGLFTASVNGVALRSMKAPGTAYDDPVVGKDPQPAHMDDFVMTTRDNGGVHINSGIPNHAFYRLAVALGGFAWERAGRIWYAAATDPALAQDSTFQDFAELTATHALGLFGEVEHSAVVAAWDDVGLTVTSLLRSA